MKIRNVFLIFAAAYLAKFGCISVSAAQNTSLDNIGVGSNISQEKVGSELDDDDWIDDEYPEIININDIDFDFYTDYYCYTGNEILCYFGLFDDYSYKYLDENVDYTVFYENNVNAGTATVTITGIGDYTGTITRNFDIEPAEFDYWDMDISINDSYYYNGGKAIKPEPTVVLNDKKLVKNVDYTLTYDDDCGSLGYHEITITGKGNYSGSTYIGYYVDASSISSASVSFTSCTYNGKSQTPTPTINVNGYTLIKNKDYTISYSNNINAGTAKATITGIGGYKDSITKSFSIGKKTINTISISKISNQNYTGNSIIPTLTVKGNGNLLTKGKDYSVTAKNNKVPGTATITVKLGSNYKGITSKSATFKIVLGKVVNLKATPASTSSIKLSWKKTGSCKYKVYRYNSSTKKYKLLTTTSSTSYTDKKLTQAAGYTYVVKTVYGKNTGPNTTVKGNTKIATPKLTLKSGNKKAVLSWNKNSRADGYQIYWCAGDTYTVPHNNYYNYDTGECWNEFKGLKNVKKASTTKYTKTGLSASKNYHFVIRTYKKINGKTVYSSWSNVECTIDSINRLNAATLKSHNSYKIYNVQGSKTTSYTHTLTAKEKKILKNFASKHFKKGWTAAQKVEYTAEWIRKNMTYGNIPTNSHTENIFIHKQGQCSDYNGALVEMMTYLGYDARLIQGYRGTGKAQHFWGEVKIDGAVYLMEVGETRYDNSYGSYKWEFLCLRYSEADGGYMKNGKLY